MKIYTRTGDKGTTSLIGGKKVPKSDLRINAYGTIDELNSFIGYLNSYSMDDRSRTALTRIQNILFTIGSNLALDNSDSKIKIPMIKPCHTEFLEREIDYIEKGLEPFTRFILPGGDKRVGLAHVCRTVCRRGERLLVELNLVENIDQEIMNYINRLSDFFFVLARKYMKDFKIEPVYWESDEV